MTGEDLKKKILAAGYYPATIAKKMDMSHQLMSARLATVDVKVSFLQRICECTDLKMSDLIDVPIAPDVHHLLDLIKQKDDIIIKQAEEIGRLKEKFAKSNIK